MISRVFVCKPYQKATYFKASLKNINLGVIGETQNHIKK